MVNILPAKGAVRSQSSTETADLPTDDANLSSNPIRLSNFECIQRILGKVYHRAAVSSQVTGFATLRWFLNEQVHISGYELVKNCKNFQLQRHLLYQEIREVEVLQGRRARWERRAPPVMCPIPPGHTGKFLRVDLSRFEQDEAIQAKIEEFVSRQLPSIKAKSSYAEELIDEVHQEFQRMIDEANLLQRSTIQWNFSSLLRVVRQLKGEPLPELEGEPPTVDNYNGEAPIKPARRINSDPAAQLRNTPFTPDELKALLFFLAMRYTELTKEVQKILSKIAELQEKTRGLEQEVEEVKKTLA